VATIRVRQLKEPELTAPELNEPQSNEPRAPKIALASTSRDGLESFHAETDGAPSMAAAQSAGPWRAKWPLVAVAALGLLGAGVFLAVSNGWVKNVFAAAPPTGALTLNTTPLGADVAINGEPKGTTPLSLTLAAGTYQVRVTSPAGQERTLDITINAGQSGVQQIEWAPVPAAASVPSSGSLQIQTDPPGQAVFVDDVRRGLSPITVPNLAAGEHRLVVAGEAGSYRRTITINAGETLSVVVAPHAPAVSAGFLRVSSPILVQLRANGDLVGNSDSDRVMLAAGEHDIEISNEALGFARTQRVRVSAGRTAEINVAVPNGQLSINAVPWAEVWLNGERLGDTPLANISTPIGTYRVTFRHPQFGEKQATVTVTARGTARLGIDMRQQ
jgi:hypothetical protein